MSIMNVFLLADLKLFECFVQWNQFKNCYENK